MKKIHSYFVCLFISLSSAASDEIDKKPLETKLKDINACLIQQTNPSGDFTQNKYITILDDPIVTTGHFKKEQKTSFIWHQVSPIDVQYILDKNQLYRVNKDGNQERLTLSGKQLEFTLINTLIKATLGKFDAISNQFSIQITNSQCNWLLNLTPRDSDVSTLIEYITISGNQSVKQINIHEVSGDKTEILLTQDSNK